MRGRGKSIRRCRHTELPPAYSHRQSYTMIGRAGEKADQVGPPAFIVRHDGDLRAGLFRYVPTIHGEEIPAHARVDVHDGIDFALGGTRDDSPDRLRCRMALTGNSFS